MSPKRGLSVLVTVLFTDIVGSTEIAAELGDKRWRDLVRRHHAIVRRELKRFRGRELDTAGDGFFARFDRPADAIRCACAISDGVRELGIEIRAGIHVGEAEVLERKVGGIAVNVAARVMGVAKGGEVLVSSTLRDAVAGSGFAFADHGTHRLKGIEGLTLYEWWRNEAVPWGSSAHLQKDGEPPDLIEGVFEAVGHPWTLTFEGGRYEESQFGPDYGEAEVFFAKPSTVLLYHRLAPQTFGGTARTTRSIDGGCEVNALTSFWCRAAAGSTRATTTRTRNGRGSAERSGTSCYPPEVFPGGCPSGQRERPVKSPAKPTEVRILLLPPTNQPTSGVLRTEDQ
jgi:class 3 adenylate cyclase